MEKKKTIAPQILFFPMLILISISVSCQSVKPYQKAYLNDKEMEQGLRANQKFEQGVHSYREGAVGGQSGKAVGGCGCN